jgi:hypothetical protein
MDEYWGQRIGFLDAPLAEGNPFNPFNSLFLRKIHKPVVQSAAMKAKQMLQAFF